MHIGLEAEGRLKGVLTLNLTLEEFDSGVYLGVTQPYGNIYITDVDNVLDLDVLDANRDPFKDPILSIERTSVGRQYQNLNIIFLVQVPVMRLKSTDQIKMHEGQHVWMTPLDCMVKSTPVDFVGDFNV